ncbi:GPI-N-acetylgalactosamine transferase PGAP4-like [Glandiceps talaboti]
MILDKIDPEIRSRIQFSVCNAELDPVKHEEAVFLSKYVNVIKRDMNAMSHKSSNVYENEKHDYGFCLEKMAKFDANYTLILQDDALLHWNFIDVLFYLLTTKVERKYSRGDLIYNANQTNIASLKLYFPEKWQGYGWEYRQLMELLAVGLTFGFALAGFYENLITQSITEKRFARIFVLLICVVYWILVAKAVGRQNLLQLRGISPQFHVIQNAPNCCIPAVLYTRPHVDEVVEFLQSPNLKCSKESPLDINLAVHLDKLGLDSYLVVPNMVDHIGLFSNLHKNPKDPKSYFPYR